MFCFIQSRVFVGPQPTASDSKSQTIGSSGCAIPQFELVWFVWFAVSVYGWSQSNVTLAWNHMNVIPRNNANPFWQNQPVRNEKHDTHLFPEKCEEVERAQVHASTTHGNTCAKAKHAMSFKAVKLNTQNMPHICMGCLRLLLANLDKFCCSSKPSK